MPNLPESSPDRSPVLEMRGIVKQFGSLTALDQVDFTLAEGEIHALLGENGAGKSTLMHIVRGLVAPTSGAIILNGRPAAFRSPEDAARAGIGMVHQHFLLAPTFTVAENLALSSPDTARIRLDLDAVAAKADEIAANLHWKIPMNARVADLSVGMQQRIEILKALLADPQILLFDEPTAVLAPTEIDELFQVLRRLREAGKSLVFVSHKLGEVMSLCNRVTVLQRGRLAGRFLITETSPEKLARLMVGENAETQAAVLPQFAAPTENPDTPTLEMCGLGTSAAIDAVALSEISFTLSPGEILGVAGVDGNGQGELAQVLTGLRPWSAGSVLLEGRAIQRLRPQDLKTLGVATIPQDRQREGLALSLSVADNLTLEAAQRREFQRWGLLSRRRLRSFAEKLAQEYDIRTENLDQPASSLSGGNQQKIVIARALCRQPALLIAVGPTRGLDVAATEYVHRKLRERQANGGAILLISTELDEVIALSTRIAVLYEGRIVGIVPADTPRETLGLMMGGRAGGAGVSTHA